MKKTKSPLVNSCMVPFNFEIHRFSSLRFRRYLILNYWAACDIAYELSRSGKKQNRQNDRRITLDCSQSPIFPWDRQDIVCLTINGGHLDFHMYLGGRASGIIDLPGSRGRGGENNFSIFLASSQTDPRPLSSFDTHARLQAVTQSARSRRSYCKIGDCEQSRITQKVLRVLPPMEPLIWLLTGEDGWFLADLKACSNRCIFKMKHATGMETCTKIYFWFIFNLVRIRIRKTSLF